MFKIPIVNCDIISSHVECAYDHIKEIKEDAPNINVKVLTAWLETDLHYIEKAIDV